MHSVRSYCRGGISVFSDDNVYWLLRFSHVFSLQMTHVCRNMLLKKLQNLVVLTIIICTAIIPSYNVADNSLARPDWKNNWKVAIFRPTRWSFLLRIPGWTDNVLNFFWMACIAVACFLPVRAKDLSAPRCNRMPNLKSYSYFSHGPSFDRVKIMFTRYSTAFIGKISTDNPSVEPFAYIIALEAYCEFTLNSKWPSKPWQSHEPRVPWHGRRRYWRIWRNKMVKTKLENCFYYETTLLPTEEVSKITPLPQQSGKTLTSKKNYNPMLNRYYPADLATWLALYKILRDHNQSIVIELS